MTTKRAGKRAHGFTIIELLVATAVFAVVLIVVTTGIVQVTRVYYKGLTEANTQDTARNIMDIISQSIQFSGDDVTTTSPSTPGVAAQFCVGSQQFSYTLGYQVVDNPDPTKFQTYHALVVREVGTCSTGTAGQNVRLQTVTGRELLNPRMRLSNLSVTSVGTNLYKVDVRIVYGDDDLLDNPTTATAACQSVQSGRQFCAVSSLSTVVQKRVE